MNIWLSHNLLGLVSQHFYLRKFPDALQRKKVKKILKEGKKAKQNRTASQASANASGRARAGAHASNTAGAHSSNTDGAQTSGNVDDRANSICWFCHGDVTSLENNKCAGCRKVTQLVNSACALCRSWDKNHFSGALLWRKVSESRLGKTWRLLCLGAREDQEEERGKEGWTGNGMISV